MRKSIISFLLIALAVNSAMAWEPDPADEMELSVANDSAGSQLQIQIRAPVLIYMLLLIKHGVQSTNLTVNLPQGFLYLNFWPPTDASYMSPPSAIVNTATPLL